VAVKSIGAVEVRVDEGWFDVGDGGDVDVDVPLDAVLLAAFFVVGPVSVDVALVFGAFVSAFANFVLPVVDLVDLPLATVACEPFDLPVEPFACVPVILTVEPFEVGPLTVAALGAPPLGAWVLVIVGLGPLFGFGVFGPASAPTASANPSTTRNVSRRMVPPVALV